MDQIFSVAEARAFLPELRQVAEEIIKVRADLVELRWALSQGEQSALGGLPEAKALEAQISESLSWFASHGVEVKGWAPLLLDLPSELEGIPVLLCWLEGESEMEWYHRPDFGFAGRRRLPESPA